MVVSGGPLILGVSIQGHPLPLHTQNVKKESDIWDAQGQVASSNSSLKD